MEEMRKKRSTRSDDQSDDQEMMKKKKIKLGKRSQSSSSSSSSSSQQEVCYNNKNNDTITITTTSTELLGSSNYNDVETDPNNHQPRQGVFDFPWLKEGTVSRSEDQWKLLEDSLMPSQLGDDIVSACTTITTPAGIEFSFLGQCLVPQVTAPELEDFQETDLFGFGTTESLDCIWSAFT